MFVVICYDITNDRRRYRIEKAILNVGYRVQESVFEAHLSQKLFIELKNNIRNLMDQEQDNLRYYSICKNCIQAVDTDGVGMPPDDHEELSIFI